MLAYTDLPNALTELWTFNPWIKALGDVHLFVYLFMTFFHYTVYISRCVAYVHLLTGTTQCLRCSKSQCTHSMQ